MSRGCNCNCDIVRNLELLEPRAKTLHEMRMKKGIGIGVIQEARSVHTHKILDIVVFFIYKSTCSMQKVLYTYKSIHINIDSCFFVATLLRGGLDLGRAVV